MTTFCLTPHALQVFFLSGGDEEPCQSIESVCFVKEEDSDALLVATRHPTGGKVELWELRTEQHSAHKMFASGGESGKGARLSIKVIERLIVHAKVLLNTLIFLTEKVISF